MDKQTSYVNLGFSQSQTTVDLESPEPYWFGTEEEEVGEPEGRPIGIKASKAATKKKKNGKEESLSQIQAIMEMKSKVSKQKLLERSAVGSRVLQCTGEDCHGL
ncbi:hypothetical protein F2Q69_00052122 [Brassica cretica]|uniref:No apical meristem-associated C-terminal domain-containing protein n=1 Tax=Brassica cretica TaxID=69181 RepID=A0A8S9N6F3_BRACR|nr:hypothetical protein F2Q69_00052122 [Brassica cretica]